MTRLQVHRMAIHPQLTSDQKMADSQQKSTTDSGEALTPLPKKYWWYPNNKIESPIKQGVLDVTPKPKSVSSYAKHSSVMIRNDPITPQHYPEHMKYDASFGQVSSAVKGNGFGTSALAMSKVCSLNPGILSMQGAHISVPPAVNKKKNSILCTVSDFDADSFM